MTESLNYANLSKEEKLKFITEHYINQNLSFNKVAELANVAPSTIKRDSKLLGVPARNKSQAQSNALKTGVHKHPTKGTVRPEETKKQISDKVFDAWKTTDKAARAEKSRQNWEKMGEAKHKEMRKKAQKALKLASKEGSKLEHFLLEELPKHGYRVSFHHERLLAGTLLQIDLMIEDMGIAIEVNGISHHEAVWGDKSFNRTIRGDNNKRAILQNYGFVFIVVNQKHDLNRKRKDIILNNLLNVLKVARQPKHLMFYEVFDENLAEEKTL